MPTELTLNCLSIIIESLVRFLEMFVDECHVRSQYLILKGSYHPSLDLLRHIVHTRDSGGKTFSTVCNDSEIKLNYDSAVH